jgi:hypothetical protein
MLVEEEGAMATLPSSGESERHDEVSAEAKPLRFLQPTFGRAAKIWWAWVWRSIVFGGAAGLFGSLILSISGISAHISQNAAQALGAGVGVALAVPVGIWVFQMILEKDFREFRVRLVSNAPRPAPSAPRDESTRGAAGV